jgi:hypothetical protein
MEVVFTSHNPNPTQKDKIEICYWTQLIGKVCVNQSIREKLFVSNFHKMTFNKIGIYE